MNILINIAANDNFQQHKFLNALHYEKKILFNLPENPSIYTFSSYFILNTDNLLLYLHFEYPSLSITFYFILLFKLIAFTSHVQLHDARYNLECTCKCFQMYYMYKGIMCELKNTDVILVKMSMINLHKIKLNKVNVILKSSIYTF